MIPSIRFAAPLFVLPALAFAGETEQRDITEFSAIELRDNVSAIVEYGDQYQVDVSGPDGALARLTTSLKGHSPRRLVIQIESENCRTWCWRQNQNPQAEYFVRITTPVLSDLRIAGSGSVSVGDFKADELSLSISGSGNMALASLTLSQLEINIAGAGSMEIEQLASAQVAINIAGSGDVELPALDTDLLSFNIVGSGDIHASGRADQLVATILGAGDFDGRALEVLELDRTVLGSGRIQTAQR